MLELYGVYRKFMNPRYYFDKEEAITDSGHGSGWIRKIQTRAGSRPYMSALIGRPMGSKSDFYRMWTAEIKPASRRFELSFAYSMQDPRKVMIDYSRCIFRKEAETRHHELFFAQTRCITCNCFRYRFIIYDIIRKNFETKFWKKYFERVMDELLFSPGNEGMRQARLEFDE